MKLRPTIFLSGVSSEFGSFRDAVEVEIQKKDCFPLNQPSFGVDYRTIEEILRRNIGEADAVIHIVGFCFGFEPKDRPPDKPRRSYTQMEYDIARELNKPVYVFLSADASVCDPNPGESPEDAEAIQLQLAHREALKQSSNIRYPFQNKNELCLRAAGIPLLATADFRVDISRIDKYAPADLIGREAELKLLDDAWLKVRRAEPKRPHIITFVALGGEGKTSLVAKWLAQLAYDNWPGCDSAFAWSFYSQGSHEQSAASSDLFLKEAISFLGNDADKEFAASNAGAYEKGQRLARIVGQRRSLLILDGLEPLQYAPASPTPSELKDAGILALLKGLAADADGLCIVTTRYSMPDLKAFWQTTVSEIKLLRLSPDAGMHLLTTIGVRGTAKEFEKLVDDVKGHALTLNLLGTYLRDAHAGDVRRRGLVKFEEADAEAQGGHAFRVIEAYGQAFEKEGEKGMRALSILRLLGLFDRPMTASCLDALMERPAISNLTKPLIGLSEAQLNLVFTRLENAKLLTINRESSGALVSLDAHPLLREYFAKQLRTEQPHAWRTAHRRLYEHLCATTPDKDKSTLEDLQPLYHAIAHGCQAGLQEHAFNQVWFLRIWRKDQEYTLRKLGVFGSDLGAIASFFDQPWSRLSPAIKGLTIPFLLNGAALCLRALGRLNEAVEPTRAGLEFYLKVEHWAFAARLGNNLSELGLLLGDVRGAVEDSKRSVPYSDRSGDRFLRVILRSAYADALHQAGCRAESELSFIKAEQLQAERQTDFSLLCSQPGFLYCDLLLAPFERATWKRTIECLVADVSPLSKPDYSKTAYGSLHPKSLQAVYQRVARTYKFAVENMSVLSVAFDELTRSRASLYKLVLHNGQDSKFKSLMDLTVNDLRRGGLQQYILMGLLTRAWSRFLMDECVGPDSALEDLDEAYEIAERGPMRLFMADIHLYRARLFFRAEEYPWESPEADLAAARKLIEQCGYWRRKEELEDAERVILKKSV